MEKHLSEPIITIKDNQNQDLYLTWDNTLIRTFRDCQFDHVETSDKEKYFAFVPTKDMVQTMRKLRYPEFFSPKVDPETLEWYIGHVIGNLDQELKRFKG